MQKVSELVSKSVGDTLTNIKTWGPLMYNALEHGVKGDWDGVKGTDDTEAMQELVNKAIAEGRKCIGLPHTPTGGMYYVTHLDNADQVVFVGDNASFVGGFTGTINQLGTFGVPQEEFDEFKAETVTQYFNVVTGYGAKGDGTSDEAGKLQSAIDAASNAGGGVVFIPWGATGIYKILSSVVMKANVSIICTPGVVIDASALPDTDNAFEAIGTSETPVSLISDATENSAVIACNTTGLAANDWVMVYSDAVAGSTNQPKGEICRVKSIDSGAQLTLFDPLCDTYLMSDNAKIAKQNMVGNIVIEGLEIIGNSDPNIGISGLMFDKCYNISVENVTVKSVGYTGINFRDTIDFRVTDCHLQDITKTGLAYGIATAWACQDGVISDCTGIRMRHLFASGGGTGRPGVPRRIGISNCKASQMMDSGFDTHPGAEDITFTNCHVLGSEMDGFTMQAASYILSGCTVRNIARHGYMLEHVSVRPLDALVVGCRGHNIGQQGVSIIFNNTYSNYRALTIDGVHIYNPGTNGISMGQVLTNRAKNLTVVNCQVHNPGTYAYRFRNMDFLTLSNNKSSGVSAANRSIDLFDVKDSVVSDNITQDGQFGLRAENCSDVNVSGNRFNGAEYGLFMTNNCSYFNIQANNARGCTTPYTYGTGTGHVYKTAANDNYNIA